MVSHDIEFCARYAHRCAMFFDGSIVTEATPRDFFSGNSFYTTSANRMARHIVPKAVTPEDLIQVCGGTLPPVSELPIDSVELPEPKEESSDWKPKPLPWWRKALATVSAAVTLYIFFFFLRVSDLTQLVDGSGVTALSQNQLWIYGAFLLSMLVFAFSVTRKSNRPDYLLQTAKKDRKLSKRTLAATAMILLLIPFLFPV